MHAGTTANLCPAKPAFCPSVLSSQRSATATLRRVSRAIVKSGVLGASHASASPSLAASTTSTPSLSLIPSNTFVYCRKPQPMPRPLPVHLHLQIIDGMIVRVAQHRKVNP